MKKYVILDLEWTSWKGNYCGNNQEKRKSWQKREIIQIGAVKFDKNYKIIDKLNIYVKAMFNPIINPEPRSLKVFSLQWGKISNYFLSRFSRSYLVKIYYLRRNFFTSFTFLCSLKVNLGFFITLLSLNDFPLYLFDI